MLRLLVLQGSNPSHFYRCVAPLEGLASDGLLDLTYASPSLKLLQQEWDAVLMFEAYSAESHEFIREAQNRGVPVLYDIDDYTFEIPPSYGGFELFYERGKGQPTWRIVWLARNLAKADLVVCSTQELSTRLRQVAATTVVIENGLDFDSWDATGRQVDTGSDGAFTVGWHGSYNHWDDLQLIVEPMTKFMRESPTVRFIVCGMPELAWAFPPELRTRLELYPFTENMEEVRRIVRTFDVGLAPACCSAFNSCKSDLRVLQYGAAGVAAIGSPVPYGDILSDGRGIVADSSAAWLDAMRQLRISPSDRRQFANELYGHVKATRTADSAGMLWWSVLSELAEMRTKGR
jgi:glycosyltransferase involved in cell wall biosynthesis